MLISFLILEVLCFSLIGFEILNAKTIQNKTKNSIKID